MQRCIASASPLTSRRCSRSRSHRRFQQLSTRRCRARSLHGQSRCLRWPWIAPCCGQRPSSCILCRLCPPQSWTPSPCTRQRVQAELVHTCRAHSRHGRATSGAVCFRHDASVMFCRGRAPLSSHSAARVGTGSGRKAGQSWVRHQRRELRGLTQDRAAAECAEGAAAPAEVCLHFLPDDVTTTAQPGDSILDAAHAAGVDIVMSCGTGSCGICEVLC